MLERYRDNSLNIRFLCSNVGRLLSEIAYVRKVFL